MVVVLEVPYDLLSIIMYCVAAGWLVLLISSVISEKRKFKAIKRLEVMATKIEDIGKSEGVIK